VWFGINHTSKHIVGIVIARGEAKSAITNLYNVLTSVINPKLHSKSCDQLLTIIVVTFVGLLENCGLLTDSPVSLNSASASSLSISLFNDILTQ